VPIFIFFLNVSALLFIYMACHLLSNYRRGITSSYHKAIILFVLYESPFSGSTLSLAEKQVLVFYEFLFKN